MSKSRKNLKLVSICLLTAGIAIPVLLLVFSQLLGQAQPLRYLIETCGVCLVGIICGYAGTQAANVPSKAPLFLKECYILLIFAALVSVVQLSRGESFDNLLSIIFVVLALFGVYFGRIVHERAQK